MKNIKQPFSLFHKSRRGFSLVEVIVGVMIVSLISVASWLAVTVLMDSAETSRNRSIALNLLQKSQEEVKRAARSFFDDLETCEFPNPAAGVTGNCGLEDTSASYPEFTRALNVTQADGAELKRVEISVQWLKFGQPRQLQSVVLIARPPDPLPGNINGRVVDEHSQLISGARIRVSGVFAREIISQDSADASGANFDFEQAAEEDEFGQFILPAGSWEIEAFHSDYLNYPSPADAPVEVPVYERQTTFVEIKMEPQPADAVIQGDVLLLAGGPVPHFNNASINLFKEGGGPIESLTGSRSYSFNIPFEDSSERCFTINTYDAFKARLAYQVNQGGSPSCNRNYNPDGWSSAVMPLAPGDPLQCGHPWNGSSDSDQICVNPGDEREQNIRVAPIPLATIRGRVVDTRGNGIKGATILVEWPKVGDSYRWEDQAISGDGGRFTLVVPAVQEMFADSTPSDYHLRVIAKWEGPIVDCCGVTRTESRYSDWKTVGPLLEGTDMDAGSLAIYVNETTRSCGDVEGNITDGRFGSGVSGAWVTIQGTEITGGGGHYVFQCPPGQGGFKIPAWTYRFISSRHGYYQNNSDGNKWYAPRGSDVLVVKNKMITYNARLWPRRYGTLEVTVVDQGTGNPISGASVEFRPYHSDAGPAKKGTTDGLGRVRFNNVPESWPPAALPSDLYYNRAPRNHRVNVSHPAGIYEPKTAETPPVNDGVFVRQTVSLVPKGGM